MRQEVGRRKLALRGPVESDREEFRRRGNPRHPYMCIERVFIVLGGKTIGGGTGDISSKE